MDKSTPRPWTRHERAPGCIVAGRRLVANTMGHTDNSVPDNGDGENIANAALILRAVNRNDAFDALVEALIGLMDAVNTADGGARLRPAMEKSRAALALATKE